MPWHRSRNERSHQKTCNRRIAIRKMKNVWLFFFVFANAQSIETGIRKRAVVVSRFEAPNRRNGVNPDSIQIMRKRLKKRQRLGMHLAEFRQVIRVTDFRQVRALLVLRKPRKVVHSLCISSRDILLRYFRKR